MKIWDVRKFISVCSISIIAVVFMGVQGFAIGGITSILGFIKLWAITTVICFIVGQAYDFGVKQNKHRGRGR